MGSHELERKRKIDGVFYNAEPNISLFTTSDLRSDLITIAVNGVTGLTLKNVDFDFSNGVALIFEEDRANMQSFIDLQTEYKRLDDSNTELLESRLVTVQSEPNPSTILFDASPPVRRRLVDGDVSLEIPQVRDVEKLKSIIGPSFEVESSNNRLIISDPFPTNITIRQMDVSMPNLILENFDIEAENMVFVARAVTKNIDDFTDL